MAQRQFGAEPDVEVARALGIIATHEGDLLLALAELSAAGDDHRFERDTRQVKGGAERVFECLLESLSEKLMLRPGVARELEMHRGAVLASMAQETVAVGQISSAVSVLGPVLERGTAMATAVFLYKLPIGFVSENPLRKIHRVTEWLEHDERAARRRDPTSTSTSEE